MHARKLGTHGNRWHDSIDLDLSINTSTVFQDVSVVKIMNDGIINTLGIQLSRQDEMSKSRNTGLTSSLAMFRNLAVGFLSWIRSLRRLLPKAKYLKVEDIFNPGAIDEKRKIINFFPTKRKHCTNDESLLEIYSWNASDVTSKMAASFSYQNENSKINQSTRCQRKVIIVEDHNEVFKDIVITTLFLACLLTWEIKRESS